MFSASSFFIKPSKVIAVVVTDLGKIYSTPDGINWTVRPCTPTTNARFNGVATDGSVWLAVAVGAIYYSLDGITWSVPITNSNNPSATYAYCFSPRWIPASGVFIFTAEAGGNVSNSYAVTPAGIGNFTNYTSMATASVNSLSVASKATNHFAVTTNAASKIGIATSIGGAYVQAGTQSTFPARAAPNDFCAGPTNYVAALGAQTLSYNPSPGTATTWSLGSPSGTTASDAFITVNYGGGGNFVAVSANPAGCQVATSTDGATWSAVMPHGSAIVGSGATATTTGPYWVAISVSNSKGCWIVSANGTVDWTPDTLPTVTSLWHSFPGTTAANRIPAGTATPVYGIAVQ